MRMGRVILIFFVLAVATIAMAAAFVDESGGSVDDQTGPGAIDQGQVDQQQQSGIQNQTQQTPQVQKQMPIRVQLTERPQNVVQNRTPERLQQQKVVQIREEEQKEVKPGTGASGATLLRQHLQERERDLEQVQLRLTPEEQRVRGRYRNVSAFVHLLLNESYAASLLGDGTQGIGPQVSTYARDLNTSLQAQFQAEERIETRNTFVRFFLGGDREAARVLEQEVIRNQDRIRQMQQLIVQCQDCDPEVRTVLREQLQQMEEQQTRLQQMAQKENQDTGLFGWLWR